MVCLNLNPWAKTCCHHALAELNAQERYPRESHAPTNRQDRDVAAHQNVLSGGQVADDEFHDKTFFVTLPKNPMTKSELLNKS